MDPTAPCRLEGVVRNYPWGSRTAIPELLGRAATGEAQAELWLGAHASAPARAVNAAGEGIALDAWIRRDPEAVLGRDVAHRFGGELPFLLKVLAAEAPLSIQAHPSAAQARAGFERENAAGLAPDAPERSYRDPRPKPELICALGPFRALCRFREPGEIARRIRALGVPELEALLTPLLEAPDGVGLRDFLAAWLTLDEAVRVPLVARAVDAASRVADPDGALAVVSRLAAFHPGDAGVLAPLFLHCVELAPGEAMYMPEGELHGYLEGVGVELMASSDNVLRGGLTRKHVDVPELLATLRFEAGAVERLRARPAGPHESVWDTPAEAFRLSVIRGSPGAAWRSGDRAGAEILLCTGGEGALLDGRGGRLSLVRGSAALVPAAAGSYAIEGACVIYRAAVGAPPS